MTIAEKIMQAVSVLVLQEGKEEFTREEIRQKIGVDPHDWMYGHTAIFQSMRADHPGGAPSVNEKFKGVFRQVRHGVHTLTEKGRRLLDAEFKR